MSLYISIFITIINVSIIFGCIYFTKIKKKYIKILLSISLTQKLTLYGIDQRKHKPWSQILLSDSTEWFLSNTQKDIGPGNFLLEFRRIKDEIQRRVEINIIDSYKKLSLQDKQKFNEELNLIKKNIHDLDWKLTDGRIEK